MATVIDPSAIVGHGAFIGQDCKIGPRCVVGPNVVLGERVELVSNVIIDGKTSIGDDSIVYPFAVLGVTNHKSATTGLRIGKRCNIREYATIHSGTPASDGTKIGDDCQIMVNAHVGHDCKIGNNVVMSNLVQVDGHVEIEDFAVLSGRVSVLQFIRVGRNAFVAGATVVNNDVVPYAVYEGICNYALYRTINNIGLMRYHFTDEDVQAINTVYQSVFCGDAEQDGAVLMEKLKKLRQEVKNNKHAMYAIDFVENSYKRGNLQTEKWSKKTQYKTQQFVNCVDLKGLGGCVEDIDALYKVFTTRSDNNVSEEVKNNKYVRDVMKFIEKCRTRDK